MLEYRWAEEHDVSDAGVVMHVAGRVDDAGFRFLCDVTAELAQHGLEQKIVLVDDPRRRSDRLLKLHESVQLIHTRFSAVPWSGERRLLAAARKLLRAHTIKALHLHGFAACISSALLVRSLEPSSPVYFSPFGSKRPGAARTLGTSAAMFIARLLRGNHGRRAITAVSSQFQVLGMPSGHSVDVVESPIGDMFFNAQRREAATPLLVAGSRYSTPKGADTFAQIAVLLGEECVPLQFRWVGSVDADSAARLREAGVAVISPSDDDERAALLSAGWFYAATSGTRESPCLVVEAMAMGMPCVALATPQHRDVISHGETGYLCESSVEVLSFVARLAANPVLRARIGLEARARCRERFDSAMFRDSLLAAYSDTVHPS